MDKIGKMANFYIEQVWGKILILIGAMFIIEGIALFAIANLHTGKFYSYGMYVISAGIQWIFIVLFITLCVLLYQLFHSVQKDGNYTMMGLPGKMNNGMAGYFSNILAAFCIILLFYCAQFVILAVWEKPVMFFSAHQEMKQSSYYHHQYKELFYAINTISFFKTIFITNLKDGLSVLISVLGVAILISHQTGKYFIQKIIYAWLFVFIILINFTRYDLYNIKTESILYQLWQSTAGKLHDASFLTGSRLFLLLFLIIGIVSFGLTLKRRRKMGI